MSFSGVKVHTQYSVCDFLYGLQWASWTAGKGFKRVRYAAVLSFSWSMRLTSLKKGSVVTAVMAAAEVTIATTTLTTTGTQVGSLPPQNGPNVSKYTPEMWPPL